MKILLASLMMFSALNAFAKDCSELTSTYDLKLCYSQEYKAQDKRLNALYGQLRNKIDNVGKAKLKKAQLAWIAYRDAECDFSGDEMRNGSMEGVIVMGCLVGKTKERADELKDYVEFR